VLRCRLDQLAARIRGARIHKQALVLVGPALADDGARSHLYHPAFSHEFRRAEVAPGNGGLKERSGRPPENRAGTP
jgi:precorrin-4/cobalt-precorrin-4 C11-methyltransferase